MAYSNATFFLDPVGGSDSARTALTSVTTANNGSGLVRCTKTAHGLVTGAVVDNTVNYTGAYIVTVIDANTFDLQGSTYTSSLSLTATPRGGASKADAWKTLSSGATSARTQAGDTVRVMASPDPASMGQSASWTFGSKTVTLTTAVTTDIDAGSAWSASANVTCSASGTAKAGSFSTSIAIGAAFTTGLAAYKAVSLNLSAKQQISFWLQSNAAFSAGQLQLCLCSDTAGATVVNTINIPAVPSASVGSWIPITVDTGAALGSSIQSAALYVVTDFGAVTVLINNLMACKASASADALTLTSLIGKARNLSWIASTTYAANDMAKPTPPNRNGYVYKVTAGGGGASGSSEPTWPQDIGATVADGALTWTCDSAEEPWYPVQSISGATVLIDNLAATLSSAGRGYDGTTESAAIWRREPIQFFTANNSAMLGAVSRSGSASGGQFVISGGWDRTSMASQTGETWLSNSGGVGNGFHFAGQSFVTVENLAFTRCTNSFYFDASGSVGIVLSNSQSSGCSNGVGTASSIAARVDARGVVLANGTLGLSNQANDSFVWTGTVVAMSGNTSSGFSVASSPRLDWTYSEAKNNGAIGFNVPSMSGAFTIGRLVAAGNVTATLSAVSDVYVANGTVTDSTIVTGQGASSVVAFSNLNGAGAKRFVFGGTIAQANDQRQVGSGYSWKFNPTSTQRSSDYPMSSPVVRIPCAANAPVNLSIWVRRDNTSIKGRWKIRGGQIAGIGADASVDCQPSVNTWTQYTLTVTPTAAGVIETNFECYDGSGTTNSLWIDTFSKS